jgi:alkylation response protein AidB-like acyl-CoA dehydrogenase
MSTATYQPDALRTATPAAQSDAGFRVDESLLEAARATGPVIRDHAEITERDRRLARPVVEALRSAGMFRLFTPRALGGHESDPLTFARVVEEIATFDSAAAWALQAGNTGAWWTSRNSREGLAQIYAGGPDLIMSASFAPPQRAVEVPGGYRVSGRGALASTIHDSAWYFVSALVFDGDQPRMTPSGPEIVGLTMRTADVEIVDTWQSLGMRGTDSNDVVMKEVFVPTSLAYRLSPAFEPTAPFDGPLYRLPALVATQTVLAPVAMAIARGAISELRETATRKIPLGSMKTLRDRASVQLAVAEAEAMLRSARLYFYDVLARAWKRAVAKEPFTLEQRADLMLASSWAVKTSARVADLMHRMGGTSGIYARNRLERHFRDAETVRHHGFVCEARLETVGQVYLGLEPEFVMVAF